MTYPPPYNPALTLTSRRYFTLPPVHAGGDCNKDSSDETPSTKKSAVVVSTAERPQTTSSSTSSTSSNPAAVGSPIVLDHPDNNSSSFLDDRTLVASTTTATASLCSSCAHENNTYLVEVINYPDLQKAQVRRRVHARADYDAVLLVYDVGDATSFDAIPPLHAEIPVCTRKNHQQHHRRATPHAGGGGNNKSGSGARSRNTTMTTSGWFGGGGGATDGDVDGEATRTGSGEIVVGLVGNKCDVDDVVEQEVPAEMTGAGTAGRAGTSAHTEDSLLHPLYRESILYEELMAKREQRERERQKAAKAKERAGADAAQTPMTPFPTGITDNTDTADPLTPEQAEAACKKNDDIKKWLSISRPEPTLPMSSEPTSPLDGDGDYFGLAGTIADIEKKSNTKTTAPPKKRQVPPTDGAMLAQALQLSAPFLETSAQSGHNVELALENIVRAVLREMGRDASGTNKAGKTCRHKERSLKSSKGKDKEKEKEKEGRTFMSLASPKLKRALSTRVMSAPPTPSVHDIALQRPESAAMFQQGDGVVEEEVQGTGSPVIESAPVPPTAPEPIQRRESVIGRMRKVFRRKSQTAEVHTGAAMPADIAV